jgi:hypothetical protein
MRDIEIIDRELEMLACAWGFAREFGVETDTAAIDELLDERAAAVRGSLVSGRNPTMTELGA